jgi:Transposase DDE domain
MSRFAALSAWEQTVSTQLPHLSRPFARLLAAMSFAMIATQSCGRTSAAVFLAALWGQSEATVRQRLREFTYEPAAKKGSQRRALDVSTCFAPLLNWVLTYWPASDPYLALALDVTLLGNRLAVLTCSVLYRGCAIPIAWKIVPAGQKGAWKPHWLQMLRMLRNEVPPSWTVLVLADRGLYARWLFEGIVANGWHPYLRLHRQGLFRLAGGARWRDLHTLAPRAGTYWTGQVSCFKGEDGRLNCTLMARWEAGQEEPWLVVTDLAAEVAQVAWYGLRGWIEAGFKDLKRGGWHWEQTKVRDPGRAERQWLVMAVATLWVVTVGGDVDETEPVSGLEGLPALPSARRLRKRGSMARLVSCFRRGVLKILAGLLLGLVPQMRCFWPEPWPLDSARPPLEETILEPEEEPCALAA